jgi:hypothetical protein
MGQNPFWEANDLSVNKSPPLALYGTQSFIALFTKARNNKTIKNKVTSLYLTKHYAMKEYGGVAV